MSELNNPLLSQETSIDHPVQPGWWAAGVNMYDPIDGVQRSILEDTYNFTGNELNIMVHDVAHAAIRIDIERMTHEGASRELLGITAEHDHLLRAYVARAAQPAAIGRAVLQFGELASAFFASGQSPKVNKVGADLGGIRQALSWKGTGELDRMAEALPGQLKEIDKDIDVHIFGRSKAMNKNYAVQVVNPHPDGRYNPDFANLLVRRRRGAANIQLPGVMEELHVIKQAEFLVVRNRLTEREQEYVANEYATQESYNENTKKEVRKRTATTGIAARVVEEAIRNKNQNPQAVIPMSAHYIAVMHRAKQ